MRKRIISAAVVLLLLTIMVLVAQNEEVVNASIGSNTKAESTIGKHSNETQMDVQKEEIPFEDQKTLYDVDRYGSITDDIDSHSVAVAEEFMQSQIENGGYSYVELLYAWCNEYDNEVSFEFLFGTNDFKQIIVERDTYDCVLVYDEWLSDTMLEKLGYRKPE